jgi:hypothetical protein
MFAISAADTDIAGLHRSAVLHAMTAPSKPGLAPDPRHRATVGHLLPKEGLAPESNDALRSGGSL